MLIFSSLMKLNFFNIFLFNHKIFFFFYWFIIFKNYNFKYQKQRINSLIYKKFWKKSKQRNSIFWIYPHCAYIFKINQIKVIWTNISYFKYIYLNYYNYTYDCRIIITKNNNNTFITINRSTLLFFNTRILKQLSIYFYKNFCILPYVYYQNINYLFLLFITNYKWINTFFTQKNIQSISQNNDFRNVIFNNLLTYNVFLI
jgi:hypothetical protein